MARREPTKSRRNPYREPKPRLLVVCGAARTEEQYLRGLRDSTANRAVDVRLLTRPRHPLDVVNYARSQAAEAKQDFDEVWCVFDVDDFDIEPACTSAHEESIQLAVSNPCFEFWLLLHHENRRGHLTRCAAVEEKLRRFVPSYDKTQLVFSDFADGVSDARDRAKDIDAKAESPRPNPSSGMWRLVQSMAGEERTGDG